MVQGQDKRQLPSGSIATALDVAAAYTEAMMAADVQRMEPLRSPDFFLDFVHGDAFEEEEMSEEDTRRFWPAWFAGFSEFDFEITRTVAAEEVVVTQWTFTGTHDGPLDPPVFPSRHAPNGRTIRFRGVSVYDVQDGLIQRETMYMDLASALLAFVLLREPGEAMAEKEAIEWQVPQQRLLAAQATLRGVVMRANDARLAP